MPDFVTLSCPTCGGKLQITKDIDRFACGHCGKEHMVNRGGGIVTISPVVEGLAKIRTGVDKTAAELALVRLNKRKDELDGEISMQTSTIRVTFFEMSIRLERELNEKDEKEKKRIWFSKGRQKFYEDRIAERKREIERRQAEYDQQIIRLKQEKSEVEAEIQKQMKIIES